MRILRNLLIVAVALGAATCKPAKEKKSMRSAGGGAPAEGPATPVPPPKGHEGDGETVIPPGPEFRAENKEMGRFKGSAEIDRLVSERFFGVPGELPFRITGPLGERQPEPESNVCDGSFREPRLVDLLGYYRVRGLEFAYANGAPNVLSSYLYYLVFERFAAQLAAACDGAVAMDGGAGAGDGDGVDGVVVDGERGDAGAGAGAEAGDGGSRTDGSIDFPGGGGSLFLPPLRPELAAAHAKLCTWPSAKARDPAVLAAVFKAVMGRDAPPAEAESFAAFMGSADAAAWDRATAIHNAYLALLMSPHFLIEK